MGKVYADGNSDGNISGTAISSVDGTALYITLLDDVGAVITSKQVGLDGSYSFGAVDSLEINKNYKLILSIEENATASILPSNWNHKDGENIGLIGTDGDANGVIDLSLSILDISNINFGINKRPTTSNVESSLIRNPGGSIRVQVVDLLPLDSEDGIANIVTIETLPTAGTLYYNDVAVVADQNITDFNNSKLLVNPNSGSQAIVFKYSATDSTGWKSKNNSRVRMPFYVPTVIRPSTGGSSSVTTPISTPTEEEVPQEEEQEENILVEEPEEEQFIIFNLDIKDDSVEANTEGSITTIDVLGNDEVGDGVTIQLLDNQEGAILWDEGTAVGGASINTTDQLVVDGEGIWEVVGGKVIFTAEDGFEGVPTPIYYVVLDEHGNQSNVAELRITSSCSCETYESKSSDSVSALGDAGMLLLVLIQMLTFFAFFRREELEINKF
jgi:hypothetical protein